MHLWEVSPALCSDEVSIGTDWHPTNTQGLLKVTHSPTYSLDTVNIAEVLTGFFLNICCYVIYACQIFAFNKNLKPSTWMEHGCSLHDLKQLNFKLSHSLPKAKKTKQKQKQKNLM